MIRLPAAPFVPPARRLALKIDVQTYRGAVHGVPRLMEALRKHGAGATFVFSLGPEGSGRTLLRSGARGLVRRWGGHSALSYYGLATLLYGTALPRPDIGRRCADLMRQVRDAGFEVGVHAWDAARWRHAAARADAHWTRTEMERAKARFEQIFGASPRLHAAVDWQMNKHAFRYTQRLGFDYAADTRGTRPFLPVLDAELVACPQVPTTLPTLEELLRDEAMPLEQALAALLAASGAPAPEGHVLTVRAELEGMKLLTAFEQLLRAWREQGMELLALERYLEAAGVASLPRHCIAYRARTRRRPPVAEQGKLFLA